MITQTRLNTTGVTGVYLRHSRRGRERWISSITVDGNRKELGRFDTFNDACKARWDAELKYGFHVNHGKEV